MHGLMKRSILAAVLLSSCAAQGPTAGWKVMEPKIVADGDSRLLSVVASACGEDPVVTCNGALSRARVLLGQETYRLLEQIGTPVGSSTTQPETDARLRLDTARTAWVRRAVATIQPAEVWTSDGDDCVWVLARLDLSALASEPSAPPMASRALANRLRTIVPDVAQPASGGTCEAR